jgi:bifunctional non-homologous end joining protein LigD
LRPTPEATVSAPLEWSEVKKGINPSDFNIFNEVKRKEDPWKIIFEKRCKLEI